MRTFTVSRDIGSGAACFDAALERLLSWQVHRAAGLDVAPLRPVTAGSSHTLTIGIRPFVVRAPVRIREVIDSLDGGVQRRGFTYETLPGHPEDGYETFVVEHDLTGDTVRFVISARSQPGRWWVRLAGPLARVAQALVTRLYLAAITEREAACVRRQQPPDRT